MYALRVSSDRFGSGGVRRERRKNHDVTGPGRNGDRSIGVCAEAHESEIALVMGQGSTAVAAGDDPWATIALIRVGEGDPAREVLLWLDVGVPVVLVPWEGRFRSGLLVDRLIPVEPHVGSDQVGGEIAEDRRCTQIAQPR